MDHEPKCKIIKVLEKNIGENLLTKKFLDLTPKA